MEVFTTPTHVLLSTWQFRPNISILYSSQKMQRIFQPLQSFLHRQNLKYSTSTILKYSAFLQELYSALFVLLFPGCVQNHGTTLALRALSELFKSELLFKARGKKKTQTLRLSKSTGLFSEMVKFSITPHRIKDFFFLTILGTTESAFGTQMQSS